MDASSMVASSSGVTTVRRSEHDASPKYDLRCNPVYQIDYLNAASGKRLSVTKRRIRFRFGFSNPQALAQGLTGAECRGEEHEVSLIWSLTSGKRTVMADGEQVHYSKTKAITDGRFETSWTMSGHHVLKLVAHVAPPLFNNGNNNIGGVFRQYDLQLDGFSFFDMPRIFELGMDKNVAPLTRPVRSIPRSIQADPSSSNMNDNGYYEPRRRSMPCLPNSSSNDYYNGNNTRSDANIDTAGSSMGSYNEHGFSMPNLPHDYHPSRRHEEPSATAPTPPPALTTASSIASSSDLMSDYTNSDFLDTATTSTFYSSPHDEFAPKPLPSSTPTEPSFTSVANQILQAYGTSNGVLALAYEPHTHGIPQQQQHPQHQTSYNTNPYHQHQPHGTTSNYQQQQQQQPSYYQAPSTPPPSQYPTTDEYQFSSSTSPVSVVTRTPGCHQPSNATTVTALPILTPSMIKPLNLAEEEDRAEPHLTELERAMKHLVNLEDITEPLETPEQVKSKNRQMEQTTKARSKPLPPREPEWHLGLTPALADIQKHKPPPSPPTKDVMRVYAFDPAAAQAGMVVVYGQEPPRQYEPALFGFGAQAAAAASYSQHPYHGGYSAPTGGYYGGGSLMANVAPPSATTVAPPAFAAY